LRRRTRETKALLSNQAPYAKRLKLFIVTSFIPPPRSLFSMRGWYFDAFQALAKLGLTSGNTTCVAAARQV
jgi:hypothetical protein